MVEELRFTEVAPTSLKIMNIKKQKKNENNCPEVNRID